MSERPIPETCPLSRTRSGQLLGFQFGLAPDGVFRAVSLALHAVRFYRTFSPLPTACAAGGLIFCGTVRRPVFQPAACVYPGRTSPGYAASRPVEFGLSSPIPQSRDRSDSPPFQNQPENNRNAGFFKQSTVSQPEMNSMPPFMNMHRRTGCKTSFAGFAR